MNSYKTSTISFDTFIPIFIQKQEQENLTRISVPLINDHNQYKIDDISDRTWKFYYKLYTLNFQMLPPLPFGTNIYTIKTNRNFPYNSIEIYKDERPFYNPVDNLDIEVFKFIAYKTPIPTTIPLYIYEDSSGIIFSLDIINEKNSIDFSPIKEHKLSPIHLFNQNFKKFDIHDNTVIPTHSGKFHNYTDALTHITRSLKSHVKYNINTER